MVCLCKRSSPGIAELSFSCSGCGSRPSQDCQEKMKFVCNSWVPGIVYVELNSKRRHTNSCSARTHVAQERAHTTASVRACVCDLLIDLISFLRASKHHYAQASEQWSLHIHGSAYRILRLSVRKAPFNSFLNC
jgi:hypothetical protein